MASSPTTSRTTPALAPLPPPTFTAIIPTPGNRLRELRRCLDSVLPQLHDGDEVLVVGDTHQGPLREVERLVGDCGRRARYLAHDAGRHAWGHPQINAGMAAARGAWLTFNDDDDVYLPDALAAMRQAAAAAQDAPRPLLFRFLAHWGMAYWLTAGQLVQDTIGGHCAVVPNDPARLGAWTDRYAGDFDFIVQTCDHYGGPSGAAWVDHLISRARPALLGAPA